MRATIDAHGALKVEAETPLEQYALSRWIDENMPEPSADINADSLYRMPNLIVSWSDPHENA